ncbi:hypothetical protein PIB30_093286 [Stylosanthes scabra]|uniref:Uncharacterized protein n=1 Tax=Stylosanthes scabra TaxID=79078 RepID=A0ABU6VVH2_9FABA|nr:hypothetical protein [Stylosanthes scabra]
MSRLAQCSPSPPAAPHHSHPPQPPRNYANNHRSRSSVHLVRSSSSNVADPYKSAFDFKEPSLKHSVSPASSDLPPLLCLKLDSQPPQPPRNYASNHRSRSFLQLVRTSTNVADPYKSAMDLKDPSSKPSVSSVSPSLCSSRPPSDLPPSPPSNVLHHQISHLLPPCEFRSATTIFNLESSDRATTSA